MAILTTLDQAILATLTTCPTPTKQLRRDLRTSLQADYGLRDLRGRLRRLRGLGLVQAAPRDHPWAPLLWSLVPQD